MTLSTIRLCHRDHEPVLCACGAEATLFCDFPIGERATCDEPICERCTRRIGDVTRLESDSCIRSAASASGLRKINKRPPLLDFDGNPFPLSYEDTVDYCPKHEATS